MIRCYSLDLNEEWVLHTPLVKEVVTEHTIRMIV